MDRVPPLFPPQVVVDHRVRGGRMATPAEFALGTPVATARKSGEFAAQGKPVPEEETIPIQGKVALYGQFPEPVKAALGPGPEEETIPIKGMLRPSPAPRPGARRVGGGVWYDSRLWSSFCVSRA